ncbi:AraC family transcriptional regulator [uncultured Draconibacterium sp.]|uniref:helix-turn-helix domain-containing protein n=1 Tax=uncultured Draconibacterium sp. TaxID=1573823 RepID=UPI0025D42010|nr:AraC family transcriptional regulator [uncultured Draconibacterium sp.]
MPDITIWNLLLLAEIGFGIVLLLFLLRVSFKLNWYLPLAVYVLLVIVDCFSEFLLQTGLIVKIPHLLYINEPLNILVGPMIYLYARSQEFQRLKFIKSDILFLGPFVVSLLVYIPTFAMSAQDKIIEFQNFGDLESDVENFVWEWIFLVSVNFTFFSGALQRFKNFNEKIKIIYSDISKTDFHLTQLIIKLCMTIYVVELVSVFLTYYELPFNFVLYNIYDVVQLVTLVVIGFDALTSYKHSAAIKKGWLKLHMEDGNSIIEPIKYASSALTSEQSEKLKAKLVEYMEKHEPYLNSQLRIKDLAAETKISSHQISQILNQSFHQNFFEFVNSYRIKKAISLIEDPANASLTITAIGFEAGFNSKTTFYEAFKKAKGTTPAKYLASKRNSSN